MIAGLVLFTYVFINALPQPEPAGDPTTDTVAGADDGGVTDGNDDGTTDGGTVDATTVTLPPETVTFLAAVDDYSARTAALAEEAQTLNDDWDARTIDFAETRDAMTDLQARTAALATEIADEVVPEPASEAWNVVITSAQTMSTAAADMFDGLVNSSTSDKRLASLDTYTTSAADIASGLDLARSAVGG